MARSRNIKPAFFHNDELAEISPLGRLFFIGLWTVSDFKGDVEYRPKKLKAQILPYDDTDVIAIITDLVRYDFIQLFKVGDGEYIHINNFTKHQNPHKNEKLAGSSTPAIENADKSISYPEDGTKTEQAPINDEALGLIPDSLNLIPDSLKEIGGSLEPIAPKPKKPVKRFVKPTYQECLDHCNDPTQSEKFINHYESNGWKVGKNKMVNWKAALTNWMKRQGDFKSNKPLTSSDISGAW